MTDTTYRGTTNFAGASNHATSNGRVASIDVFRALIMFLMIFVNDLPWSKNVPHMLEHALPGEDMLGFADIILPAFLFIVGMAIPFAFENRKAKGDTDLKIYWHVIVRSFALIIIGVLIANRRLIDADLSGYSINVYSLIIMAAFFLIWNIYPRREKLIFKILPWVGVLILLGVILTFRSTGDGYNFIKPSWGILGVIGWSYLFCSGIYLLSKKNMWAVLGFCVLYYIATMLVSEKIIPLGNEVVKVLIGHSVSYSFTISGLALSLIFRKIIEKEIIEKEIIEKEITEKKAQKRTLSNLTLMAVTLAIIGVGMLILGFISHYFWIISKTSGTPTWMFLCIGISVLLFLAMYCLVDVMGKGKWFNIIKPAGTATLTCYMLPYIYYSIRNMTGPFLPDPFYDGFLGIVKCLVFALLIVGLTALLGKVGVKLKL